MKKIKSISFVIIILCALAITYGCKKESAPVLNAGHYNSTPNVSEQVIANIQQTKESIRFAKKVISPIRFSKQINYADDAIPYCIFLFSSTFTVNTTTAVEYHFINSVGQPSVKYSYMIFGTWVIKGITYPFSGQIANCIDECELGAAEGTIVDCTFYTSDGQSLIGQDQFKVKPIN